MAKVAPLNVVWKRIRMLAVLVREIFLHPFSGSVIWYDKNTDTIKVTRHAD